MPFYRKKIEASAAHVTSTPSSLGKGTNAIKKKRTVVPKKQANVNHPVSIMKYIKANYLLLFKHNVHSNLHNNKLCIC